jgi:signal transduction histidine kinase
MNPPGWLVDRLPEWARSIRFRYTLLYSAVLFGLAAVVVAAIYLVLLMSLRNQPVSASRACLLPSSGRVHTAAHLPGAGAGGQLPHPDQAAQLLLRAPSGCCSWPASGVGWVVAGRVLRPIGRITSVARDIQATDLSRRIELPGPDDELKQLGDTFDAMLARLDAAFAAQRQFVADASHELRNPLAIIRTNVDVALADPRADPEDLRHTIVVVKRASDRMARLVDDLLALARRQEPILEHEPVDLGAAVAEASDDFVVPAAARNIVLDRAIAPGVVVTGDRDALKRAVANLLENAVRLAPEGSRIRLATGSEGDQAWIAVADEGPGHRPRGPAHVFDRFWRGRQGPLPGRRRHRPRPGHRPPDRREPRRPGPAPVQGRGRLLVRHLAPGGRRAPRPSLPAAAASPAPHAVATPAERARTRPRSGRRRSRPPPAYLRFEAALLVL